MRHSDVAEFMAGRESHDSFYFSCGEFHPDVQEHFSDNSAMWSWGTSCVFSLAHGFLSIFMFLLSLIFKCFSIVRHVHDVVNAVNSLGYRFCLALLSLSKFLILTTIFLLLVGDPEVGAEQICSTLAPEGWLAYCCTYFLSSILSSVQNRLKHRFNEWLGLHRLRAAPCRLGSSSANPSARRTILDGGCTNHTLMCGFAPILPSDMGCSPHSVNLNLAGGSRLPASLYPSEEVFVQSSDGNEENLLSQERICSYGGRLSATWSPTGERGSPLRTVLFPGGEHVRSTLNALAANTPGCIECTHEDRTTYVDDDSAFMLRQESVPFPSPIAVRRVGGNFDGDVSLRILGVHDEAFIGAYDRSTYFAGAVEHLVQLHIEKAVLYDVWKRSLHRPKTFISSVKHTFDSFDQYAKNTDHDCDGDDADDLSLEKGVSFGDGVVFRSRRANAVRAPRFKRESRKQVPISYIDLDQFSRTVSSKHIHFCFLLSDGRSIVSDDKVLDGSLMQILVQRLSLDKRTGLIVEYHRPKHVSQDEIDKHEITRVFCDVITVSDGAQGFSYLFVFAKFDGAGTEAPTVVSYPSVNSDEPSFLGHFNAMVHDFRLSSTCLFELTMEQEGFMGVASLRRFAETGCLLRPCLPNVSPWQEVFCRNVLRDIRTLLFNRNLPAMMWPFAANVLREATSAAKGLARTSEISPRDLYDNFGKIVTSKIARTNLEKSKVEPVGVECLMLGPWGRSRWGTRVLFGKSQSKTSNQSFSYTGVDWRGCTVTNELCFRTEREGLETKRFIHKSLAEYVVEKREKKLKKNQITCERCLWEIQERGAGRPPAHDYTAGCKFEKSQLVPKQIEVTFHRESLNGDLLDIDLSAPDKFSVSSPQARRLMMVDEFFKSADTRLNSKCASSKPASELPEISGRRVKVASRKAVLDFFKAHRSELELDTAPEVFEALSGFSQQKIRANFANKIQNYDARKYGEMKCYAVTYNLKQVKQEIIDGEVDWLAGLDRELRTLIERGVLRIIPWSEVTADDEILPSLLVMTRKSPQGDEKKGRAKFRLTACGNFALPQDTDNLAENYADTLRFEVANSLLRLCAVHGFSSALCDVSEAFTQSKRTLNGDSRRRVLRPPSGLRNLWCDILRESGYSEDDVNKFGFLVTNSIYGERDAPKIWSETFSSWITDCEREAAERMEEKVRVVKAMGFTELQTDSRVYVKRSAEGVTIVLVYVDDVVCTASTPELVVSFMSDLRSRFRCTDIEWIRRGNEFFADVATGPTFLTDQFSFEPSDGKAAGRYLRISQEKWLAGSLERLVSKQVLTQASVEQACPTLNPKHFTQEYLTENCDKNPLLQPDELTRLRAGVNTLSYLGAHTRLEILPALGAIARGQSATTGRARHLTSLEFLIRYVATHKSRSLRIWCSDKSQPFTLVGVECDADSSMGQTEADCFARQGFILSVRTRLETSSGVYEDAKVTTSWKSGLQSTISVSSTEAEIVAASWATRAMLPLHYVIEELFGILDQASSVSTPVLFQDNESACACAQGGSMRRLRHLTLHQLYVRFACKDGRIRIRPKRTTVMTADILTKVMADVVVSRLLELCGVSP